MATLTIQLPDELESLLREMSKSERRSEADLICQAVETMLRNWEGPPPRLPLFSSDDLDPSLAERIAENRREALRGFGEE